MIGISTAIWAGTPGKWLAMAAVLVLAGCSVSENPGSENSTIDPLKNTRKLVAEGHRSLYKNGAFTVPFTELKFIPPGPEIEDLLFDAALPSARDSFILNVAEAKQAIAVVSDGTRYSFQLARKIHEGTSDIVAAIRSHARPKAKLIGYRSYLKANGIRGEGWAISSSAQAALERWGRRIERGSSQAGDAISESGVVWIQASPALAEAILEASGKLSERVGAGMNESAAAWRRALTRQGDTLILSGTARLGTSPKTVADRMGEADRTAEITSARIGRSGRELAAGGSASGDALTERGLALAGESVATGRGVYEDAARMAGSVAERMNRSGKELESAARETSQKLAQSQTLAGEERTKRSTARAEAVYTGGMKQAGARFGEAGNAFVIGYAAVPEKISGHMASIQPGRTLDELGERTQRHGDWRRERSDKLAWLVTDSIDNYSGRVALKLKRAGEVFDETLETGGVSLAGLKAVRWVVEALLWDGVVEPVGNIGGGMLGYLAVNGVAYPAMVTYEGARATVHIAVQIGEGTAKSGWEIIAPTGQAALAGLMGMANAAAAVGESAAVAAGGGIVGGGQAAAGQLAGAVIHAGGTAASTGLRYIAVPAIQAGLHMGGGAAGIGTGSVLLVAGGAQALAGQLLKGGSKATGAVMENVAAPVVGAAIRVGGTAGGVIEGFVDELTGVTLMATGGVLQGSAVALEASIKYGAAPVAKTAVVTSGMIGGVAGGGIKAAGGTTVYLWGRVVKASGWVAGNAVEHVGAPVTMAGIAAAGEVGAAATEGGGGLAESATLMAGEAAAGVTWLFGNTIAGGALVGGTAVSVTYGVAVGLFEIASAMVVPVGHLGGAGIVLSYKSISQLAAHSVLAVADASYLVLSLEGPRWVLYAVRGDLNDGSDLKPGTVMDLKAMQEQGEVFYNVPVSGEEMSKVVGSVTENLPPSPDPEENPRPKP